MVRKNMQKTKRKIPGKGVTSLLIGVLLLAGLTVSVSAAGVDPDAVSSADGLFAFWSDLIDWFASSAAYCSSAYFSSSGLTFLGVIAISFLALSVLGALILWIWKFLRFGGSHG